MPKLIAIVMFSGVVLAACGGGGSSSATKTATGPTKSQFVAEADAVCKSTEKQTSRLVDQIAGGAANLLSGGAGAAAHIAGAVQQLHNVGAAGLAKLRGLAQPGADHKQIARFLMPLSTIVDSIGTAASGLREGQGAAALAQLQADQSPAEQVTTAAKAYGLRQCESLFSSLG